MKILMRKSHIRVMNKVLNQKVYIPLGLIHYYTKDEFQ